ncbi:MAG: hypothetical protein QOC94_2888 [Actinoplanes sp.]|nr:hypothetical protein [Actinoplanes sp.]
MPVEHDDSRTLHSCDGQNDITGADRTAHPQPLNLTALPGQRLAEAILVIDDQSRKLHHAGHAISLGVSAVADGGGENQHPPAATPPMATRSVRG